MSARYTLRMQFGLHEPSDTIREEVLRVCRDGAIDEVMFFAFAEEQNDGHDSLERIAQWMAAIRPWKRALEAAGIEVGLNPWHSLLHTDRHRVLKPGQSWQNMVDWRGQAATAVVCPLDPDWRAYYAEAMRLFAVENFRVIWIDDDIRYHNHAPLDWGGCWCPLHTDEFNKRTGANASREEIVAHILEPGGPHPWRAIWFDLWDERQAQLVASWRDIVEAYGTRLGLMSSNLETHAAEGRDWNRWWNALAKRFPATHRPHFWGYSEDPAPVIVYGIGQMQQNRMVQPPGIESDPEIESFPYGPWNKSFRQTAAQMALAQIFGSDRLAVSLYDFMGNLPSDEPERAPFLARMKPLMDWLSDTFAPTMRSVGIGTPWHPDMGRKLHTSGRINWRELELCSRGWDHWLAPFGFAFQKSPHATLNALSGAVPWGFDDAQLREWLTHGLLLDGPAASLLVQRGFGALIGLDEPRFVTQADALYSMEESIDGAFGLRSGAQMSMNAEKPYCSRLLQGRVHDKAQTISILRSPTQQQVGHGAFVFENALGGRVAVVPWDATAGTNLCTQRRAQLARVIDWLSQGASCGRVDGGAWLVPQFMTDGNIWRGVIWNASPDALQSFAVTPPRAMGPIKRATHCDAQGNRTPARIESIQIRTANPVHQWEYVIIEA